jgi:hypothetical protein
MSKSEINQLVRKFIDNCENDRKPAKLPAKLKTLFKNVKKITKTKLNETPIPLNNQDDLKTLFKASQSTTS